MSSGSSLSKFFGALGAVYRAYVSYPVVRKVLIAFVLGAVVGAVWPGVAVLKPLGDLLVRLLKMIVMPVVFFSLVVGAASISPKRLGRIGVLIMVYYLLTSAFAVVIGLAMANIFRPGVGLQLGQGQPPSVKAPPSPVEVFLNLFPTNPFAALSQGQILPTIVFAIILGIAIAYLKDSAVERLREEGNLLLKVFDGLAEAVYKIIRGVLQYMPIGVFALIGYVVATYGPKVLGPLAIVVVALYVGLFIHIFGTYGALLALARINIVKFIMAVKEAMITAFVTRSSSGTLPVTMRVAEENLGIKRSVYAFTLPLGATVNMDGTAMYQGICALFVANALGIPLTLEQQLMIVLTATLASIGTAGVPGAGLIMLAMVLEAIGLPLTDPAVAAAYAMIAGIDVILDMGRTMVNVTGDLVGTTLIAKLEGEIDTTKPFWK